MAETRERAETKEAPMTRRRMSLRLFKAKRGKRLNFNKLPVESGFGGTDKTNK
jgi:hypothetical protein